MCFLNLLLLWFILQVHSTNSLKKRDLWIERNYHHSYLCLRVVYLQYRQLFQIRKERYTRIMWIDMFLLLLNWIQDLITINSRVYLNSRDRMYITMGNSKGRHFKGNGVNIRRCIFLNSIRRQWRSMIQKYRHTQ